MREALGTGEHGGLIHGVPALELLADQLHRLLLTLELERLERAGYQTGVMARRQLRRDAIVAELGWLA